MILRQETQLAILGTTAVSLYSIGDTKNAEQNTTTSGTNIESETHES